MIWRLFSTWTFVTIESGLTTLELHITTVPVEYWTNSATRYGESAQCNDIMVCARVCVDIEHWGTLNNANVVKYIWRQAIKVQLFGNVFQSHLDLLVPRIQAR